MTSPEREGFAASQSADFTRVLQFSGGGIDIFGVG